MIRGLGRIVARGCPYHGRCLNDIYELGPGPPYPTVATRPVGATWGPAIPIVHPNAPGSTLSAGTDRDWGQYIGHSRSINGADGGTGIGWDRWLYCDPTTDATWLMRVDFTVTTSGIDIEVWCDGVFGRRRPDNPYVNVPRLVNSFTWTPDLPSWNTWGYTVAQVMAEIQAPDGHGNLSISRDGSTVWLHFFTTTSGNIAHNLYGPTNWVPHYWGLYSGISLAGIAKVTIAGSSTADDGGAAITATITKDLVYQGSTIAGLCWSYTRDATGYTHQAILYRTEDGDIIRHYSFTFSSGAFTVTHYLWGQTFADSGTAVSSYGGGCELRVFAQNAIYVATYKVGAFGGSPNTFKQNWYGLDQAGSAYEMDANTVGSAWAASSSAQHEMPYVRRWVGTYSPHNPTFTFEVYDATYLATYTGTTYQWI